MANMLNNRVMAAGIIALLIRCSERMQIERVGELKLEHVLAYLLATNKEG